MFSLKKKKENDLPFAYGRDGIILKPQPVEKINEEVHNNDVVDLRFNSVLGRWE